MHRRRFLRASAGAVGGTALAGCLDAFETQSAWRDPPLVEDRPDAVYVPTAVEEMGMYGTATDGEYGVALTFTFPHRFWTLTGRETNRVEVRADDSLHLMATVWDRETETVLPTDVTVELARDGEQISRTGLWPMLSQTMGFHYGDNLSLPEDGEYVATVQAGPLAARRTGAFAERLAERATVEIAFEYESSAIYDLELTRLDDRSGERDAVDRMSMGAVPTATAPPVDDLPGRVLGTGRSGDAALVATVVEDERLADDGTYLAVSARTPYNRIALPLTSLSATVTRDGETAFEGALRETLDDELGHHYGAAVGALAAGDEVTVAVDAPPQAARHDGYETAFLDMPAVTFEV